MTTAIPTLLTPRVRLCAAGPAHMDAIVGFLTSERARFVGGPLDRVWAWRRGASWTGHWLLRGYGGWALEERASGEPIGFCGVLHWPLKPERELGWLAFERAEGRGLIAEAARAAIAYVRDGMGWDRLASFVAPNNERSIRLARGLGATNEGPSALYRERFGEPHDTWRHDLGRGEPAEPGEATVIDIPTIESERLVFRPFTEADIPSMSAFYADEATARHVGGVSTPDAVWRRVAAYLGHWHLRGYGLWALEEKATGQFVGYCGHYAPEGWPEPEIAYGLMAHAQGRGLATEAATRALRHAYEVLGWQTAISAIDEGNMASRRVAERLGASREATMRVMDFDAVIYRHLPPDQIGRAA